jgi:hypothetical protein
VSVHPAAATLFGASRSSAGFFQSWGLRARTSRAGVLADADEDVAQVVEGVDAVQLARGNERVEDAGSLGSFVAASRTLTFDATHVDVLAVREAPRFHSKKASSEDSAAHPPTP